MTVVIRGLGSAIGRIQGVRIRADNPSPMWPQVGTYLSAAVGEQFISRGARFGTPWKPLTPNYLRRKLAGGFGSMILVATGELMSGFVGRPMDVEVYHGDSAEFGSSNMKAIWHHNGTHRNGKRVNPPRPILKATSRDARAIAEMLAEYIAEG